MVYVKLQVEKRLVPRSSTFISYDDELISVSAPRYTCLRYLYCTYINKNELPKIYDVKVSNENWKRMFSLCRYSRVKICDKQNEINKLNRSEDAKSS